MPSLRAFAPFLICAFLVVPASAQAQSTGGAAYEAPPPENMSVAGAKATLLPDGTAAAPAEAPEAVKQAIWAANRLQDKPYKYGGGHAKVEDTGYDCSGTVSYALIKAGLLRSPLDSGSFMSWAQRGKGKWISVYAHGGHAFAVIAGLRLDTGSRDPNGDRYGQAPGSGPRWNKTMRDPSGYRVRHPGGF